MAGDSSAIVHWDVGAADASGVPAPTNSMLETGYGTTNSGTNQYGADPTFITEFDTSIALLPWRTNPNLIGAIMVATDVPASLMGNYHIPTSSVAKDNSKSATSVGSVAAPTVDIDGGARPTGTRFDLGADELPGTVVVAFPRTSVLDAFGRSNGSLGSNWDGDTAQSIYRIQSNQVQVRDTGIVWWKQGSEFGPNQEAFFTLTSPSTAASQQGLILKGKSLGATNASYIKVVLTSGNHVQIWTKAPSHSAVLRATLTATFAAGDKLGARTGSDGIVTVYRNGIVIGGTNVTSGPSPWSAALAGAGGRIGATFTGTTNGNPATFDDFGGGNF
jgi:sRNA-binding carbon storage regulator CsrA